MLEVCSENEFVLDPVPSLLNNRSFVEPLPTRNIEALCFVPQATHMSFSDLIRKSIPSIREHRSELSVSPTLFEDRAFALAWYSATATLMMIFERSLTLSFGINTLAALETSHYDRSALKQVQSFTMELKSVAFETTERTHT